MGLSLTHDHEEAASVISEPDRLCVGVIMKDDGPMAVWGEIVYIGNDPEGVMEPID